MELFRNDYYQLTMEYGIFLRFKRSSVRFESLESLRCSLGLLEALLRPIQKKRYNFLFDMRKAPLRADPAFESIVKEFQIKIELWAFKTAFLVQTTVGSAQLNRQKRESQLGYGTFRDEPEAISYLLAESLKLPSNTNINDAFVAVRKNNG